MAEVLCINRSLATVYSTPDIKSEPTNQLLYGEAVTILKRQGDWVFTASIHDNYQGWILLHTLEKKSTKHSRINALCTHMYAAPNFKTVTIELLYFLSQVQTTNVRKNNFIQLENDRWVFEDHLGSLDYKIDDITETALKFLGAPYLWGGRSMTGIDCSGLVQISLMAAGIKCPRDTYQQQKAIGKTVSAENLQRGDLVYFKGHVGIMVSKTDILNATARSMDTRIEQLDSLISHYGDVLAVRRL